MRTDENWAVAPERIAAFFREQPDVHADGDGFHYRSCAITLESIPGKSMGKWAIPRTRVIMDGDDADVRKIPRRFFLRFLSAGG